MKKVKMVFCLWLVLTLLISGNYIVRAIGVGEENEGQTGNNDYQTSSGANMHPLPYVDGIRISFIKADGTHLGSTDFILDSNYNSIVSSSSGYNYNKNDIHFSTRQCSRASYGNGKCTLSWDSGGSFNSKVKKLSELTSAITVRNSTGTRYTFDVDFDSAVDHEGGGYLNLFNSLQRENNPSLTPQQYNEFVTILFNDLLGSISSGTIDDFIVPDESYYDLFMVYEPIDLIKVNNRYYMGTAYELANVANANNAIGTMPTLLRGELPCTSYLTGDLYEKLKSSTYFGKYFKWTSSGLTYFNNGLIIDYANMSSVCVNANNTNAGRVSVQRATGKYANAVGILWLSDYIESGLSCETVINGISWEWETAFATRFKQYGIEGLYNYANNASAEFPYGYIGYNGGTGRADLKWFINECTCYGMYDLYEQNKANIYTNNHIEQITNISTNFGDIEWYIPTQLYIIKSKNIKNYLTSSQVQNEYNTSNKEYASDRDLQWTDVSYEKYEALGCGHEDRYWCDEFDEWYTGMKDTYSTELSSYPSISTMKSNVASNQNYKEMLDTMLEAYNLRFYPATNFYWTTAAEDTDGTFSYILHCTGNQNNANSCQMVKNFYLDNQGINLDSYANDRLSSFDFSAYNNAYNTNITNEWYISNCSSGQSMSYNCTPKYNLGTCITGETLEYVDSSLGLISDEYWDNCVFDDIGSYEISVHKESDKNAENTYFEPQLGNSDYCEVYCIEELASNFASPNISVEAGTRFTWQNSRVSGSRTCRTKSVDWEQFEEDLEDANEDIVDKYATYMLEKAKKEAIDTATADSSNHTTPEGGCDDEVICPELPECPEDNPDCNADAEPCTPQEETFSCECGVGSCQPYTLCSYSQMTVSVTVDGVTKSETIPSWSYTISGHNQTCAVGASSANKPSTNVTDKENSYKAALNYAKNVITKMQSCYSWDANKIYNVNPVANITYSDGTYSYSGQLSSSTTYSTVSDQSVCTNTSAYQIQECTGNTCPTTAVSMRNCSGDNQYAMFEREATTTFSLDSNVFRYVLKGSHISIHANQINIYNDPYFTTNYIDIGFPNFPVAYSTPSGLYGSMHNNGTLDVKYTNLGHTTISGNPQIGQLYTPVDRILSNTPEGLDTDTGYGKWICQFNVYTDLLPDDPNNNPNNNPNGSGDIKVVYRTIDLIDPFPDIDGSYRNTGSNWCDSLGNCSYNNQSVVNFITDNRRVDNYEIYAEEPMYTFILTPSVIREIRRYNDENSYDASTNTGGYASYTGVLDGEYYDYKCNEATGRACISDYFSHLLDITNARNLPGACVNDRNYSDPMAFYGCRYQTNQ